MSVTLTIGPGNGMKPFRSDQTFTVRHYPESTSQTFLVGDIVQRSTVSGHENSVQEAVTSPTTGVVGLAADAATGTADSDIGVWEARGDREFIGVLANGIALARTHQDLQCGVTYDGTNKIWRINSADTSNKVVEITDISLDAEPNGIGTVNAHVAFKFLVSATVPFNG